MNWYLESAIGNCLYTAVTEIQLGKSGHRVEGLVVNLLDGVVIQLQFAQWNDVAEGPAGHVGQHVVAEVELDEVGETSQGRGVDLTDAATGQVDFLEVQQVGPLESLARQRLQVTPR